MRLELRWVQRLPLLIKSGRRSLSNGSDLSKFSLVEFARVVGAPLLYVHCLVGLGRKVFVPVPTCPDGRGLVPCLRPSCWDIGVANLGRSRSCYVKRLRN